VDPVLECRVAQGCDVEILVHHETVAVRAVIASLGMLRSRIGCRDDSPTGADDLFGGRNVRGSGRDLARTTRSEFFLLPVQPAERREPKVEDRSPRQAVP
jgi:hypothetical protein